jgi:tetratricopeptide (TPR) repeat protein
MSVTETGLKALIAGGENDTVEFKRELNLDTALGKSEFLKDIIAIANSARPVAYLLVGVDDDGQVTGGCGLMAERIQQIIDSYVTPAMAVAVQKIMVSEPDASAVVVIEVSGSDKPYSVARPIERLSQHDVYVRHGSVVTKPTPNEIVQMRDESTAGAERRRLLRKAEASAKLGKLQEALSAYTAALNILPTAETFIERGRIYMLRAAEAERAFREASQHRGWSLTREIKEPEKRAQKERELNSHMTLESKRVRLAIDDFSAAIKLAESEDIEKAARLARLALGYNEEDLHWLQPRTVGREAGELLYRQVAQLDDDTYLFEGIADRVLPMLDQAIALGFDEAVVYLFRAQAHYRMDDLGLALSDIEKALEKPIRNERLNDDPGMATYLGMKALILSGMGRLQEAFNVRIEARDKFGEGRNYQDEALFIMYEILGRYAICCEFAGFPDKNDAAAATAILRALTPWMKEFQRDHPSMADALRRYLGRSGG